MVVFLLGEKKHFGDHYFDDQNDIAGVHIKSPKHLIQSTEWFQCVMRMKLRYHT